MTHTHARWIFKKNSCIIPAALQSLNTWIMGSHRVKMVIQKKSQAGTELFPLWNILILSTFNEINETHNGVFLLFSLDHKKADGKWHLIDIGSNPHSMWDYCTHWVRTAVISSSKLLKTMSNLNLSLPSNNSWPFPCVPVAPTQGQLGCDIFVVAQVAEDPFITPSQPLLYPLNKLSFFKLSCPSCPAGHLVLCRDLSSSVPSLRLGTIQVWAQ